ncbi:hypothetical protein C8J57DRAFT_1211347 [Mycena rebaudengoi]|nr:hypothetical protein C8J57DRAFT_1211347 [Mycena rebaudengoi]
MRSFTTLILLALVVASALSKRTQNPCRRGELCTGLRTPPASRTVSEITGPLTNAMRLARGLPLNKPRRRSNNLPRIPVPSNSPYRTVYHSLLEVRGVASGLTLGYVSKNFITGHGDFGITNKTEQALQVDFGLDGTGTTSSSYIDFYPQNADSSAFGYLGFIQAIEDTDSNISFGSFQYGYLGLTSQTSRLSLPVTPSGSDSNMYTHQTGVSRTYESAIWSVDITYGFVDASWINQDESYPTTILFLDANGAIRFGGDLGVYRNHSGPATEIALHAVLI